MRFCIYNHTRAEATSGDCPVPPHVRQTHTWLDLDISKEGDSTLPLGNLFHCLTTLTVKKDFLPKFKKKFIVFQSVPMLSVLSLGTTEKGMAPVHPLVSYL